MKKHRYLAVVLFAFSVIGGGAIRLLADCPPGPPGPPCLAPKVPKGQTAQMPEVSTVEVGYDASNRKVTRIYVDLQGGAQSMEPVAEPRNIRIDDRANVQLVLRNLSPLDVCTRAASPPTANTETSPAESLTTTIAGLGGFAPSGVGGEALNAVLPSVSQFDFIFDNSSKDHSQHEQNQLADSSLSPSKCTSDPEFLSFNNEFDNFLNNAPALVGSPSTDGKCPQLSDGDLQACYLHSPDQQLTVSPQDTQLQLGCKMQRASRELAACTKSDYRANQYAAFRIDGNDGLVPVKALYLNPVPTALGLSDLQASVDRLTAYAADLHKKYDYKVPSKDEADTPSVSIPGLLMVAPTSLAFSGKQNSLTLAITSGGTAAEFTAEPFSDSDWLHIKKAGDRDSTSAKLVFKTGDRGQATLVAAVDDAVLNDGGTHNGSIVIEGVGRAKGTTIVYVVVKPVGGPKDCDLRRLGEIDGDLEHAKAMMSIISDGNKTLQAAQAALKTSYDALIKVEDDYKRRLAKGNLGVFDGDITDPVSKVQQHQRFLYQVFDLGTDRKVSSPGYLSCVSDVDMSTTTTTNINYTLLYQDIPKWTASAGFLVSFQPNLVIGITESNTDNSAGVPAGTQYFAVTSRPKAQVLPMAFLNYRVVPAFIGHWGSTHENELITTLSPSVGFGLNPNSGTTQPEFFGGFAVGWNHFMLHPGVHIGRTESLGGGFKFGDAINPATLTAPPLNWSYHFKFSVGFSVRVAPY